jgi:putative transposase
MVTSATYQKELIFKGDESLCFLNNALLKNADIYGWTLQAWAIFPNHYHFIGSNSKDPASLRTFLTVLHQTTASHINRKNNAIGRCVWYEFWDSYLSFIPSYFARLKYVHQNAVHHRLVNQAEAYPWCSAAWFATTAPPSFRKTIDRFKTDAIQVIDDFY